MARIGALDLTFWLTQGVARSMGISLTEALADGRLDRDGYAAMVAVCRCCRHARDCMTHAADPTLSAQGAPAYCHHRPTLNEIALRS